MSEKIDPWFGFLYLQMIKFPKQMIRPFFYGRYFESANEYFWDQIQLRAVNERERIEKEKSRVSKYALRGY